MAIRELSDVLAGVFQIVDEFKRPICADRHVVPGWDQLLRLTLTRISGRGDVRIRAKEDRHRLADRTARLLAGSREMTA